MIKNITSDNAKSNDQHKDSAFNIIEISTDSDQSVKKGKLKDKIKSNFERVKKVFKK